MDIKNVTSNDETKCSICFAVLDLDGTCPNGCANGAVIGELFNLED